MVDLSFLPSSTIVSFLVTTGFLKRPGRSGMTTSSFIPVRDAGSVGGYGEVLHGGLAVASETEPGDLTVQTLIPARSLLLMTLSRQGVTVPPLPSVMVFLLPLLVCLV